LISARSMVWAESKTGEIRFPQTVMATFISAPHLHQLGFSNYIA
jgi:hypothetical protein